MPDLADSQMSNNFDVSEKELRTLCGGVVDEKEIPRVHDWLRSTATESQRKNFMRIFSSMKKTTDAIRNTESQAKSAKSGKSGSTDTSIRRGRAVKSLMSTLLSDDSDARDLQAGEYLKHVASQQTALREAFRGIDNHYNLQHTGCVHLSSLEKVCTTNHHVQGSP
mmetsp:Transcript_74146/g.197719  ORF Transcript_74146/g.197719 Transcript_74146/m.197719 type:complete len:166 (-) Transcript_74146:90-587(-)